MNLIFLNSLEKKTALNRVITAQVSISERQGVWNVVWNEPREDGRMFQDCWFEGERWEEMLAVFRLRSAEKRGEGYVPVLGEFADPTAVSTGKAKTVQMLHYYGELHCREELFQELRKWRREQALKENKAPFIIASNRLLRMISAFVPKTREELLQIPGFGESKTNLYGESVLNLTKSIERQTEFPLDWVAGAIDHREFTRWMYEQRELKLKEELDRQTNKKKLLEGIFQGENLTSLQQILSVPRRELLLLLEELEQEGYDLEPLIAAELETVPPEEREAAWKAFEEEGDRYLKPVFRKVYGEEPLKDKDPDRAYEWLRLLRLRYRREKNAATSRTD